MILTLMLSWIHLSDWHQKGASFDRTVVRNAFLEDIRKRSKISKELVEPAALGDGYQVLGQHGHAGWARVTRAHRDCIKTGKNTSSRIYLAAPALTVAKS
jgi:hypothetical protein